MTTVTAIRRTKPKAKAQHKLPSGPVLPLGKQLAHTGKPHPPLCGVSRSLSVQTKKYGMQRLQT